MNTTNKSWEHPSASTKKFLAREIMYRLSRQVEKSKYEVVLDGDLDIFNNTNDQPDLVVYQRQSNFSPVVAIELSTEEKFQDSAMKAITQFNKYGLKEFLIYNLDDDRWYSISEQKNLFGITSNSEYLNLELGKYSLAQV